MRGYKKKYLKFNKIFTKVSRYKIKLLIRESLKDIRRNIVHIKNHYVHNAENDFATLRMLCHMLDKGMNNPLFEKGHSSDVFHRAQALKSQLADKYSSDKSFSWCEKILDRFAEAGKSGVPETVQRPVPVFLEEKIAEYKSFLLNRVSCRNFKDRKIQRTILEQILEIAVDAPNGCCRQVVRYHISQDEDVISEAVRDIAGITNFSKIPCLVCVSAETGYYELIDRNLQFVDASLSVENFLLGASLFGIYGTICNFFHADEEQISRIRKLFNVHSSENIILFIAIGYPVSLPEKPVRRNIDVFVDNEPVV